MRITSYVELTPAQEHCLENLERVIVRTSLIEPTVIATIKTFQGQELKLTIDKNGVLINSIIIG